MNILIIGSGGREHALAWKIRKSPECEKLYVAPGNAGTGLVAENVPVPSSDFEALEKFVLANKVRMVVAGPEAPLVAGLRDYFAGRPNLKEVLFIGPGKEGAQLEGSKDFAKKFMQRHNIPTAGSHTFTAENCGDAVNHIRSLTPPIVLKADGLAAGKGVIICGDREEAENTVKDMLEKKMFGEASSKVVIEDFLRGIELSVFLLTDGSHYLVLPEAKDYKRIGRNDTGPNTGGMGAVSPVIFANREFMNKVEDRIIKPTVSGLKEDKIDYRGFLFIGLMNCNGEPYVIEYNVRMGDPESQVVFPRLESDLVSLLEATAKRNLNNAVINVSRNYAVTVVLASEGYPGNYEKGKIISGLQDNGEGMIFHAGTKNSDNGNILTNGGRVLAVTGTGPGIDAARNAAYSTISGISWEGMQFRDDIGEDLMALEQAKD